MKVLYDISVLGLGQYNPLARTGVARVIENVAYGLANSESCDLIFCETLSFPVLKGCLNYLSHQSEFSKIPFIHSSFLTQVYQKIIELNAMLQNQEAVYQLSDTQPINPELLEYLQQTFTIAYQTIEASNYGLTTNNFMEVDIFHATFRAIPPVAKEIPTLKRFLTVYDLIPAFYPEFFVGQYIDERSRTHNIDSLSPDDWVISISESTKQDLCNYLTNFDPDRIFVTHLAADPSLFFPCTDVNKMAYIRQKYGIPEGPYILGLSTLEPRKNLDHLVRCFARLVIEQNIQDLSLILVGKAGWNYDQLMQEVANQDILKNRIILAGRVDDVDLSPLYSGAMVFAYPSLYEGFGLPPLEAMQCGTPVITSNNSSLPEVIGDAGIMLEPRDQDAWCESFWQLYQQPNLRMALSQASLHQAQKFSWKKCVNETIQAYQIALNS